MVLHWEAPSLMEEIYVLKFMVRGLLMPGLENLSITLLACEMSAIVR